MPYGKRKSRKRSRRFGSLRRRRYRKRFRRSMAPLSLKTLTKMKYHDEFNLDVPASGVPVGYVFSCNGTYDPNISGTGHQPRGHDQMATLYDHNVVIGFKARCSFVNADTGNAVICAIMFSDSPTLLTSNEDVLENRFVRHILCAPEGSGPAVRTMTARINPNKFLGRSKPLADPDLKNSAGSNPTEQVYMHVYVMSHLAIDANVVYTQVDLEYTSVWIEPKQPSIS